MRRLAFALLLLTILSGAALALAQQVTPAVPFGTPPTLVVITPDANDARAATCSASTLPNFVPYIVRPGDRLADLIASSRAITVTQLAVVNCIDDPDALPVGATIWLPAMTSVTPLVGAASTASAATAEATAASASTRQAVSAVSTEVPEATAVSTSEASANAAQIQSFSASASTIINTQAVTFSWSATGSDAYFYLCATDKCVRPQNAKALPVTGGIRFDGFQSSGTYRYRLDVDGAGGPVTQDASVTVTCAQQWLGGVGASPRCPQDPARTVYGVWQPFEHGIMIWFSDTKQIYVMKADGTLDVYADQYVEGQPSPGDQAPAGRFTPVRGFGLIWQALGSANNPLGWATAKELGYDAARQAAGDTSYTTYIQGPNTIVYAVTLIPGQAIGYWAQVAW